VPPVGELMCSTGYSACPRKLPPSMECFSIDGIGTVLALPTEDQWDIDPKELILRRERIQIRTRSGNCLSTFIRDIEMINRVATAAVSPQPATLCDARGRS